MAPVSNAQGATIAICGIVLLVLGVAGLVHCDQMGGFFFQTCQRNDWAGAGAAALIIGIVSLLLGLILPFATQPPPPAQNYGSYVYAPIPMMPGYPMMPYGAYPPPPPYGAYPPAHPGAPAHNPYGSPAAPASAYSAPAPPAASATAAAAPPRSCTRCGNPVTSQFCASCGAQQW